MGPGVRDDDAGLEAWFTTQGVIAAEVPAAIENRDLVLDLYQRHCRP